MPRLEPVWTPDDAAALREVAEQFPCEVGNSVVLDFIVDCEGLSL